MEKIADVYQFPYGQTCPLLRIAEKYGEDYSLVLDYADFHIHNRTDMWPSSHSNMLPMRCAVDIIDWCNAYKAMRDAA